MSNRFEVRANFCKGKPNALYDTFDVQECVKRIPPQITDRAEDGLDRFNNLFEDLNSALSYCLCCGPVMVLGVVIVIAIPVLCCAIG